MTELTHHKSRLRDYFDGAGFERWAAIYGQAPLSRVRRTIREGHTEMLGIVESWLADAREQGTGNREQAKGVTPDPRPLTPDPWHVLDAGCGTGLLAVALAQRGCRVTAVDIAPQMVAATQARAREAGVDEQIDCAVGDLEEIDGEYDAVVCLDVLIHYPHADFAQLVERLARRTRGPLLLTYAPHEPVLAALHWVGGRFPHAHRRTDIQMIRERDVHQALTDNGMRVGRIVRVSRGFYHVALVEGVKG
jgi:magnesium-protoporphyrin O-methyltransferase